MSLLNKSEKAKPLRSLGRTGAGGSVSSARPQGVEKLAPCIKTCPAGNDPRAWLTIIAQAGKTGVAVEEALDRAWQAIVEVNPLPAVLGRVCPHPCEGACNRSSKDGAVAVNSVERFLGDWGLERRLRLPGEAPPRSRPEKIAVVGSGPAGLACAYHLARRGYPVTVFESLPAAGGMLRYGIPAYRLPRQVLDAEIQRICDLGVELRLDVTVGKHLGFESLRREFAAVFLAVGAHVGKRLGVPGEEGPGVYCGTEYLRRVAMGERPAIGRKVVVVGGGDTAVDAARVCLRQGIETAGRDGVEVTILYRRTRTEMPAIDPEIVGALEEGVKLELLAAPAALVRDAGGNVTKVRVQRMRLGDADASGRRAPVPIDGEVVDVDCDTLIAAVSQEPDLGTLGAPFASCRWLTTDEHGRTSLDKVWTGGDDAGLGLATTAVGHGRRAAEAIDATLRSVEAREPLRPIDVDPARLKLDFYETRPRAERLVDPPEDRLARPWAEIDHGITKDQALAEVSRCLSCGRCFGCERCWMFCTPSCFGKIAAPAPGAYYSIKLETCDGCKKCSDECPCGYLDMI